MWQTFVASTASHNETSQSCQKQAETAYHWDLGVVSHALKVEEHFSECRLQQTGSPQYTEAMIHGEIAQAIRHVISLSNMLKND